MKNYDEIEAEAIRRARPKKPKMKVSGKSVFILDRAARKPKKKS